MATTFAPIHPVVFTRPPLGQPRKYGHRQEALFRTALAQLPGLQVVYDHAADTIYKLDAIVWHRNQPLLPAVGVQFTLNPDEEKRVSALSAIERSDVVSRFLYVQLSRCDVDYEAVQTVSALISRVAELPGLQVMLSAVVARDPSGLVIHSTDLRTVRHSYQQTKN